MYLDRRALTALIFDVDGTLYNQAPVRCRMLWRLLAAHLRQPARGIMALRALAAYRRAQECLREAEYEGDDVGGAQVALAGDRSGIDRAVVSSFVARWMEQEPLDLVARYRRDGVLEFLQAARERGLRLAVFSDYPAGAKLAAMRLAQLFDVVLTAQDPEVQRLKPNPRGLEIVLRRIGVDKSQALYIGDRPEVDALAAARVGMPCVIIGRKGNKGSLPASWMPVSSYHEFRNRLCWV